MSITASVMDSELLKKFEFQINWNDGDGSKKLIYSVNFAFNPIGDGSKIFPIFVLQRVYNWVFIISII